MGEMTQGDPGPSARANGVVWRAHGTCYAPCDGLLPGMTGRFVARRKVSGAARSHPEVFQSFSLSNITGLRESAVRSERYRSGSLRMGQLPHVG